MSDTEGAAPPKGVKRPRTAYVQGPIAPIAHPMAGKKLHKKIYKIVKKAADAKALKRGVKEVVKAVRKGDGGLVVIAGDISPIDVISHLPVMCEDGALPYVFIQSKAELGAAAGTQRPTSVVLVSTKAGPKGKAAFDGGDRLKEVLEGVADAVKGNAAEGDSGEAAAEE